MFSLLGPHGYKYAESAAIEAVRKQIMNPEEKIIPRFAGEISTWKQKDGIIASQKTPGWVVKLGSRIVLLPRGWDLEFYERIDNTPTDEIYVDGSGTLWYQARFGANPRVKVCTVPDDPLKAYGEDLFGALGRVTRGEEVIPFLVVDVNGQEVTIMITAGLEVSGPLV